MSLTWVVESKKSNRVYWFLQFAFWITNMFLDILVIPEKFSGSLVLGEIFSFSIAFLLSLVLRNIYRKFRIHKLPPVSIILILLLASIVFGIIWFFTFYSFMGLFKGDLLGHINFFINYFWVNFFSTVYPFIVWSSFYLGFKLYEEYIIQKGNAEKAATLAQSAQLEMLRYQLNPHFLFNTLSSLRALIRNKENDTAEEMVTKISEFLKYSLLEGENSKVPLSREIKTINHYFDIEKVRFGDQLMIEYSIDPLTEKYPIPVFLIHPLVENAVKHGMKTSSSPLKILIKTEIINNTLSIEIANSGQWIEREPNDDSTRTGLQNSKKRLELAYPNHHTFEIVKKEDSVQIKITINENAT